MTARDGGPPIIKPSKYLIFMCIYTYLPAPCVHALGENEQQVGKTWARGCDKTSPERQYILRGVFIEPLHILKAVLVKFRFESILNYNKYIQHISKPSLLADHLSNDVLYYLYRDQE